jgi:hypothetical protein
MELYCCALESKGVANKSLWFDDRLRKFAFLLWHRDVDCKTETNLRAAEEYLIANKERENSHWAQPTSTPSLFCLQLSLYLPLYL